MSRMSPQQENIPNCQCTAAPYDAPQGRAAAQRWLRDRVRLTGCALPVFAFIPG
jgi:hypothetical protein